jgi:hypothetical protein
MDGLAYVYGLGSAVLSTAGACEIEFGGISGLHAAGAEYRARPPREKS